MQTLDLEEAASFLKCSDDKVMELARSGELPGVKVGRKWVFIDVDLADWMRTQYGPCRLSKEETSGTTPSWTPKASGNEGVQAKQTSGKRKRSTTTSGTNSPRQELEALL